MMQNKRQDHGVWENRHPTNTYQEFSQVRLPFGTQTPLELVTITRFALTKDTLAGAMGVISSGINMWSFPILHALYPCSDEP